MEGGQKGRRSQGVWFGKVSREAGDVASKLRSRRVTVYETRKLGRPPWQPRISINHETQFLLSWDPDQLRFRLKDSLMAYSTPNV